MVTSVVPTVCVSTAWGLACGYLTWAIAGTASNRSGIRASLRIVARILAAVRPDEETIFQQDAPAAAVDDLDLQVRPRGDAVGTPLDLAQESRLLGGGVPRVIAAQRSIVEEERGDADAAVLKAERDGADAVRRQGESGDVELFLDGLARQREIEKAEGAGVVRRPAGQERRAFRRALAGAGGGEEPVADEPVVAGREEAEAAAAERAGE